MINALLVKPTDNFFVQFIRYAFVGGIAFVADFSTLVFLTEYVHLHYLISAALGFVVGVSVNYAISVLWVFNSTSVKSKSLNFAIFALIGVVGLGLNELIMWLCTDFAGLHYAVSKAVSTAIVYFWNFIVRRQTLFNPGRA